MLLPVAMGLEPLHALESSLQPSAVVTVYVPAEAVDAVTSAMVGAGAGRIGDYTGCSFVGEGTGSFTASDDSHPAKGVAAEHSRVEESRVEMVCPRRSAVSVVAAAVSAHPYEEPLVTVSEIVLARNAARIGMISELPGRSAASLRSIADDASRRFGVSPRVWGDPERAVRVVATSTGSAGSLIPDAISAGADVLVAGEVRYHDALDAAESGLAIIELGHDVSEWPMVALLERVVLSIEGLDRESVRTLPAQAGWWTSGEGKQ